MSETETPKTASLLARVNFPIYCVKAISERHILIGGGGGISKTGISNPFEIYELTYDPINNTARATLATHFDVGGHAIMNMCVIPMSRNHFELPCGGMQGMCHVYDVKFTFKNGFYEPSSNDNNHVSNSSIDSAAQNKYLRRRHFSLSSQHSTEDVEDNIAEINESAIKNKPQENIENISEKDDSKNKRENSSIPKTSNTPNNQDNIPDYIFEFELTKSFQTDHHQKEPYQKLIKYSPASNMIFSAGADGQIRLWSLPDYKLVGTIKAHDNEIDDLDIHPKGYHLVSVSRDGTSSIWNIPTRKLLTNLDHTTLIPKPKDKKQLALSVDAKYNPRLCRYSIVEGDDNNVRLFVALNTRSKLDSYLTKWFIRNDQYHCEKIISAGDSPLFAMAISDDGRFLAVGKQTGDVDVYISFSLQRCYQFQQAHNIFVTGIEFLPTKCETLELVGGQVDAALISVSVDNRIVLHKIPKRATLGFFGSFLFFVLFILFIYTVMNYFDL